MKQMQWNAKGVVTLSMLTFSLVAGSAFAQVAGSDGNSGDIKTQVDNSNKSAEDTRIEQNSINTQNVPLNLRNSHVDSQPVIVSPGMAPSTVSAAPQGVQVSRDSAEPGLNIGAPGTGIGGSNPGNANTGGVQVQSVNVQTSQDANLEGNRSDVLRRQRMRQEVDNESRLIEKVEEGRLEDERSRTGAIQGFNASAAKASASASSDGAVATAQAQAASTSVTTVPVTAVGAGSSASANAGAAAVAVGNPELSADFREESPSRFAVSPFIGHRWMADGNTEFKVTNTIVVGANLSGQMNDFFALEGSFSYGRDELKTRGFGGYNGSAGYINGGGGGGYYGQFGSHSSGYYGANSYYSGYDFFRSRDSFDVAANAKLGIFSGKFRPYGLAGIGGIMQHYNIDNAYTTAAAQLSGYDRNTSHLTGQLGGGVDVELSKKFTVGARFDYQRIFDSNKYALMNQLYGDGVSRYRLVGSAQLIF